MEAAFYPLPLIRVILRGIRATADEQHLSKTSCSDERAIIHALATTQ